MAVLLLFAFLAGVATVLSPCVLPLLPVILSGTAGGRRRPLGIIAGFVASFSILTLTLSTAVRLLGLDPDIPRVVSAFVIIILSLVFMLPALKNRFMLLAGRLASRSSGAGSGEPSPGFRSGLLTGVSLGAVWAPCVGPIMASVIGAAIARSVDAGAVYITLAYALGTSLPLFAIMGGGRTFIQRRPRLRSALPSIQRIFGVLMLLTGIALLTGWDRDAQTALLRLFPSYGAGLTALEENAAVKAALDKRAGGASSVEIDTQGADPLTRTAGPWLNSPPLTLEGLRGKVVMVDFWTYSCINCRRTIPYLRAWHQRYAEDGLVIIGVHSPEFAFEGKTENLREAVADLGVVWPVVQDRDFGIWNAFSNRYWPAKYLFDRDGRLVFTHFGEGAYIETERMIQSLLGMPAGSLSASAVREPKKEQGRNEETYLGTLRGADTTSQQPDALGLHEWALEGSWRRDEEYVESTGPGRLFLDFYAREIYLVIEVVDGAAAPLDVRVNGIPTETADVQAGNLIPSESRLYRLYESPEATRGTLTISAEGKVRFFAFTFS